MAAAEASWGRVGSARGIAFAASGDRTFWLAMTASILTYGEDGIRLFKHFNTCENDEIQAKWGGRRRTRRTPTRPDREAQK